MTRRGLAAALLVAIAAFSLYRATLLPGVDFGDTGSFQTMAGSPMITPRDGYPLYFAIGAAAARLAGGDAAHALNLASAIEAAVACGLVVLVAAELSGSIAAAVGAALLFAVSYTFWSQAVIAEVYSLHLALVALTLLLLLRWAGSPSTRRLFAFFAVYAAGFGNHLSMILLLPGYAIFLLLAAPRGWRSMFAPRIVGLALACAVVGALQYGWNLRTLWLLPDPPSGPVEALQRFWFDVTKSDWRETMVMNVPQSRLGDHLAMYWFDLRQQFGLVAPLLGAAGMLQLTLTDRRRAILLFALYAVNVTFAYSYNVGDAHVFYLPSHLMIALLAAPALMLTARFSRRGPAIAAGLLIVYAGARGYHDFPALDRSRDRRPGGVVEALASGLDGQRDVLLTDLNWQTSNAWSYLTKAGRPDLVYARLPDVFLYAPALIADNRQIDRRVVVTQRAQATLAAAYGPLLAITGDDRARPATFAETIARARPGTRYVLCALKPSGDRRRLADELAGAIERLTATRPQLPAGDYVAIAGTVGEAPALVAAADRPFRRDLRLRGVEVEIRMDSWLESDTIRRMGFGHVVAAHQHTLIVERGLSFAAFDDHGQAVQTAYASNIFEPERRFIVDLAR